MLSQQEFRLFEEIKNQLKRIANALEAQDPVIKVVPPKHILTKESILKYTSEDELFALFNTFKEYMRTHLKEDDVFQQGASHILDRDIGEIIKQLKANYK